MSEAYPRTPSRRIAAGRFSAFAFLLAAVIGSLGIQTTLRAEDKVAAADVTAEGAKKHTNWPMFRGNKQATGVADSKLPDDMKLIWEFKVDKGAFDATAAIYDGVVYIGDADGVLFALNLEDGKKIWSFDTESGFIASPSYHDGKIFLGDFDGMFYCVDAKDGKKLWTFEAEAEIDSGANFFSDKVLFGSQDATLYCLNIKDGSLAWKHQIEDQIRCTPTLIEDHVFLAGCDGKLHVLKVSDEKAETVGQVEIGGPTGATAAAEGDHVYFGTEGTDFFAINWRKPEATWKFEDSSHSYRGSPVVLPNLILVPNRGRDLYALDRATGKEKWKFTTKQRMDGSASVAGNRVYFATSRGRIYGLDVETGKEVWQTEVEGGFASSPAIADGKLVIASDEGVVYGFGAK